MTRFFNRHRFFIIFYGALFLAFLGPVIILQKAFLLGDYRAQFYPWAMELWRSLREGVLPYWTPRMGMGFPLMAEGQVAGYYAFHWLSYSFLPFRLAYAWDVPVHLLAGGIGFYLCAKKSGLSREASAFGAILFSFSSAYGGHFYTTGTLRVLTWLPWSLWALESANKSRHRGFWAVLLAVFFSQMATAGFPQIVLYTWLYLFLWIVFSEKTSGRLVVLAGGLAGGVLLALPQILSTAELAGVSVRAGQDAAFALWGSALPLAPASLLFPKLGVLMRSSIYIGMAPLVLAILAMRACTRREKIHLALAAIFFIFALGKFNPLYVWAVGKFGFLTAFRNPSKFIFFSAFSLCFLSARGLDLFLENTQNRRRLARIGAVLAVAAILASLAVPTAFNYGRSRLAVFVDNYAQKEYAAKSDPVKSSETYRANFQEWLGQFEREISFSSFANLRALLFLLLAAGVFWAAWKFPRKKWLDIVFLVTALDLYVFGVTTGVGFVGNTAAFKEFHDKPGLSQKVMELGREGRVAEFSKGAEIWEPSANVFDGVSYAGAYSPILLKRYYELYKDFGFADASLGRPAVSETVWKNQRALLDLSGTSLIVSDQNLDLGGLDVLEKAEGRIFYRNSQALPQIFGAAHVKVMRDKAERLEYLKSSHFNPALEVVLEADPGIGDGARNAEIVPLVTDRYQSEARVQANAANVVVFQTSFYSRWKASVDGRPVPVVAADHAFSAVVVPAGEHRVRFYFDWFSIRAAEWFSAFLMMVALVFLIRGKQKHAF